MHIEAKGLGRSFGRKAALTNLYFECRPGEIIALIGNNGAGKTTLLQAIAGLLLPTRGELLFDGENLSRRSESHRRRVGIIPDLPIFFPEHSVLQHIAMVCRLYNAEENGLESRAVALMEEIGIIDAGRAQMVSLSRGELFKTAFVALLLARPELWLLDEPMASGMDPRGLNFLRKHLRAQADEGASVIYSTQIPEIAEQFSDRIFVLQSGSLMAQEPAESLKAQLGAATLASALEMLLDENREPA